MDLELMGSSSEIFRYQMLKDQFKVFTRRNKTVFLNMIKTELSLFPIIQGSFIVLYKLGCQNRETEHINWDGRSNLTNQEMGEKGNTAGTNYTDQTGNRG